LHLSTEALKLRLTIYD